MKTVEQHTRTVLRDLYVDTAGSFAECLAMEGGAGVEMTNAFGRTVMVQAPSLSLSLGHAITGMRTSALMDVRQLHAQRDVLASFIEDRVPLTVVATGDVLSYLSDLIATDGIIFYANQHQQIADLILTGQVISEKALVPVIVLADLSGQAPAASLSWDPKKIRAWMGDPDGRVADPSQSQQMVFGAVRRRMPAWLSSDVPAMVGSEKIGKDASLAASAYEVFERTPIQQMIDASFEAFKDSFGRDHRSSTLLGDQKPRRCIVLPQQKEQPSEAFIKTMKNERVGMLSLSQMHPLFLPGDIDLRKTDRIVVLDPVQHHGSQGPLFKAWKCLPQVETLAVQLGFYIEDPSESGWQAVLDNLVKKKDAKRTFWLDVPFTRPHSELPKHQLLIEEVKRRFPEIEELTLVSANAQNTPKAIVTPLSLRPLANAGPPFAQPARFHDNITVFHQNGGSEALADPFQAYSSIPVATAAYAEPCAEKLPTFDPMKCTGCLACLPVCPHAALPGKAFSIESLLQFGISKVRSSGFQIKLLTPMVRTWSKVANERAATLVGKVSSPRQILEVALDEALKTVKEEEKRIDLELEGKEVIKAVESIPTSVTERLFQAQHRAKAGTGSLLTFSVDVSSCTGCGFCVTACDDDALTLDIGSKPDSRLQVDFEALPQTTDLTIEESLRLTDLDGLSLNLLNTQRYRSLIGVGNDTAPASVKSVLRMILAQVERVKRSAWDEWDDVIGKHITGIRSNIKKNLGDTLPVKRFDTLMGIIDAHQEDRMFMDRIFDEWGREESFKIIERKELERQLHLLDDLGRLRRSLNEGILKQGRAKATLVLDRSMDQLAHFPWNHFVHPVLFDRRTDVAELSYGIVQGAARHLLDNVRLLRRGALEAKGKYDPSKHDPQIAKLTWHDLEEDERRLMPPVIIVGDADMLSDARSTGLHRLTQEGYPVKVLIIDQGTLPREQSLAVMSDRLNALWPYLVSGKCDVARLAFHDLEQVYEVTSKSMASSRGALLTLFAPDASGLDILPDRWIQACALAERTRAITPISFIPDADQSFAKRMNILEGNLDQDWERTQLSYGLADEEQTIDYEVTWADWAYLMKDWRSEFQKIPSEKESLPVADFLALEPSERMGKRVHILRVDDEHNLQRYEVSQRVLELTLEVLQHTRILREWSGLFTEFPERLHEKVREELSQELEQERKAMKAAVEKERSSWEAEHMIRIKQQVKERLVKLSGR